MNLVCPECDLVDQFYSSPDVKPEASPLEINNCTVIAFREIGRGRNAMLTFTNIMNMPPP